MKKVVALELGFFNGSRVRKGSEIVVPDDFKGSWVADVETSAAREAKKQPEPLKPMALSELARAPVQGALEAGPTAQAADLATDPTDIG